MMLSRPSFSLAWIMLLACVLTIALSSSQAAARLDTNRSSQVDQWQAALAALDEALIFSQQSPGKSNPKAKQAEAVFEQLLTTRDLSRSEQARIQYNLGIAAKLNGELGVAMLALRRAETLDPGHAGVAKRLASLRQQVQDVRSAGTSMPSLGDRSSALPNPLPASSVAPVADDQSSRSLLAWFGRTAATVPRPLLAFIAVALWILTWMAVIVRLCNLRRSQPRWLPVAALGLASITLMAWLVTLEFRDRSMHDYVIVREVTARQGPDDVTAPISSTLPAGTEGVRAELALGGDGQPWVRLILPDAVDRALPVWVPQSATQPVMASPSRPSSP